jgi:hypothetical protein
MKRCIPRHAARPAKGTNVDKGMPAIRRAATARARPTANLARDGSDHNTATNVMSFTCSNPAGKGNLDVDSD